MKVIEGSIEKLVPGGAGLLRDDDGIVLVKGGLPGDTVRVQIEKTKHKTRFGSVLQVLAASPERVPSDCAHHPRCGGCDLLELSPTSTAKLEIVRDALRRVGRIPDVPIAPLCAPGPEDDRGRRRAKFVVVNGRLTYSVGESHDRVEIETCIALHPHLRRVFEMKFADGELRVACDDSGRISTDRDDIVLEGEVTAGLFPAKSDARIFTQATRFGGRAIIDAVVEHIVPGMKVLELFAGAGHLTLPMQKKGALVDPVEGDALSVRYLQENTGAGRQAWIDAKLDCDHADVVVADPPRAGAPEIAEIVEKAKAQRVVMVSCDPATGARDLGRLVKMGFVVDKLVPIDAFPRTSHIEWVASLRRAGARPPP